VATGGPVVAVAILAKIWRSPPANTGSPARLEPYALSAIIVDDEQLARDELAYLLKNAGDITSSRRARTDSKAVNLIKEHNPDLVFLDVQMPGLDGFGVIKKLLDRKVPLPRLSSLLPSINTQ